MVLLYRLQVSGLFAACLLRVNLQGMQKQTGRACGCKLCRSAEKTLEKSVALWFGEICLQLRDAHQLVQELHTGSHGSVDKVLACGHGILDPRQAAEKLIHDFGLDPDKPPANAMAK